MRLPIELQRHFNNYLSGALPLCVVLGTGHTGWFEERFAELHSYRIAADGGVSWIDFNDTFAYRGLLGTDVVGLEQAEQLDNVADYLEAAVAAGTYVILFVDLNRLQDLGRTLMHEFLVYGFEPATRSFVAAGFDRDRRFQEFLFPASALEAAFRSGLEQIRTSERWNKMTAVAQTLTPGPRPAAVADPARIVAALRRYLLSVVPDDFDPYGGYWWYSRAADVAPGERIKFGLDVYDDAREHLRAAAEGQVRYDYRVVHLLAEHKRIVLDRLRLLTTPGEHEATISAYSSLVGDMERLRLAGLKHTLNRRRPLSPAHETDLAKVAATERSILTDFLEGNRWL
ncbi:hypothetical protein OG474_45470 [Kribbella sp. NBC_01505]|uniref:hypothetical protein n=1 Tax=Kribbella sp. NBC_01505 TaxID=2903580 RepID=UPI003865165B